MDTHPEYASLEAFAEYLSDDERNRYTVKEFGELCLSLLKSKGIDFLRVRAWLNERNLTQVKSLNRPWPGQKRVMVGTPSNCPFKDMNFKNERHTYRPSSSLKFGDCLPHQEVEEIMAIGKVIKTYAHRPPRPVVYKITGSATLWDD